MAPCGLSSVLPPQQVLLVHYPPWPHERQVLGDMLSLGATELPVGVWLGSWGLPQGLTVTISLGLFTLGNTLHSKNWLASDLLGGGQFHWRVTTAKELF